MSKEKALCARCTITLKSNEKVVTVVEQKRVERYCSSCNKDREAATKLWESNESEDKVQREATTIEVPEDVRTLYSVFKKHSGQVGGDLYGGEIYGEMTMGSFQRIVEFLMKHCEFGEQSVFLDVGSGLGKPNCHVAVYPGVKHSLGLELMDLRWQLSLHNLRYVMNQTSLSDKPPVVHYAKADACDLQSLNPCTHMYMFDVGFVRETLFRLAKIFNQSSTLKYLVSSKKPRDIIFEYCFLVRHIGSLSISMTSSSEQHSMYIYEAQLKRAPRQAAAPNEQEVSSPLIARALKSPAKPISSPVPASSILNDSLEKLKMGRDEYLAWLDEQLNQTLFKSGTQTRSRAGKRRKLFE